MVTHATSFLSAMDYIFTFGSSPPLNYLPSQRLGEDGFRDRLMLWNHSIYEGNLNCFRCSQVKLTHPQAVGWSTGMHLISAERGTCHLARPPHAVCQPWRSLFELPSHEFHLLADLARTERKLWLFAKATKPAVKSSAVIILFINRKIASKSNKRTSSIWKPL